MERLENQSLSNSCKTINLKTSDIFISSFPGKIVFGNISQQKYSKFNYFEFLTFELYYLYISLVAIIKAVISEENESDDVFTEKLILKVNEDLNYLWSVVTETKERKCIELILQHRSLNKTYKITFNLDQLNDFISALSEIIVPTLCLKSVERQFLEFICDIDILNIVNLDRKNGILLLCDFKNKFNINIDSIEEFNILDTIIYYKELIIILKKIKSLINPISNHIESILSI